MIIVKLFTNVATIWLQSAECQDIDNYHKIDATYRVWKEAVSCEIMMLGCSVLEEQDGFKD